MFFKVDGGVLSYVSTSYDEQFKFDWVWVWWDSELSKLVPAIFRSEIDKIVMIWNTVGDINILNEAPIFHMAQPTA